MKKITLTLAAFAIVFTAFAQDVVIERPADNTTALITTNGSDDAGVFCADFFTLEEDTTLGSFTFPGFYSSATEIGDLLTGADLYIYQDLNGSPNANPTTANALVNLTSVQLGAGLELRLVDNIESGFIINVTAANGGSQITLPAGDYWVAFAPAVVGGSAGAGRWNWNGSFTTQTGIFPANESLLIDSDDLFGAGATDWTGISSLIGADFPSFAWTLTSEGTTTGGTTFITCADDVFNDTYCYTNNDTTDKVYTSDTGLPLRLTFTGGTVELNFDEVIILDSDGVTNLNTGNPYGNNGDMTGFVFESSGDTLTLRVNSDGTESCENGGGSFVPLIYNISCLISGPPPGSDIIVRPSSGATALISTHGNDDLGVYCADFFTLNEPIVLGDFTFDGYTSSNGSIASLLLGAELYIYQNAGANPDGNPTAGNAFVNLTNIQQNVGLELLTDGAGSTIFQINVTAANGGTPITLPAGSYWVAFAPFVQGGSAGAGRWNWNGSSITPANQPVLIDLSDLFGAGATDWTNISSLIGQDFPSLAWTLTSGETTTPCQIDTTPPELSCPDDQTASADTGCMFNIPDYTGLATATDNCAVTSITQDPIAGTMVDTGSLIITLTASDGINTTDCSFILSVIDTTPPELTCPDDQTASADTGCMFNIPDYTGLATATDNCAVTSITQDPIAGTMVDTGSLIITLTASDGINTTDCSFILSVIDTTPPELTCPDDQTVDSEGPYSLPDYFATGQATAIDNCTDSVTDTNQIPNPGALLENGTYIITLTAQDENGLEGECSFTLVVNDLLLETQTNELSLSDLRLYPNPASDKVIISNPGLLELETISVYDLRGRLMIRNNIEGIESITIDTSILQSATYMIVIESKYGNIIKRLLIE